MLPPDGAVGAFTEVGPFLKNCQVVIGNLEGPLTDRGSPTKNFVEGVSYIFRTPPAYAERLREAGFTVMSLANNHAYDYGPAGYSQTREVLEKAGLLHTGAPGQVAYQKVGRTTVAVIGLAPNSGCQDLNDVEAAALVRQVAAQDKTLVVVVFHGGAEGADRTSVPNSMEYFLGERRGEIRRLGRALIDAGAHLVVGHGPHVPRGLELCQERLIAYSPGNFATGRGINISGKAGLAPLLVVEMTPKGELVRGRIISFRQDEPGRPRLDTSSGAAALMYGVGLTDFELPALSPDGTIVVTEGAVRTTATAYSRSPRSTEATMTEAEPSSAEEQQASFKPPPIPSKSRANRAGLRPRNMSGMSAAAVSTKELQSQGSLSLFSRTIVQD